jgi:dTMP kinase
MGTGRGSDRFEGERADFHRRVRDGFLAIAKAEPARVVVIDADRPVAAVTADIRHAVDELLARR